MEMDGGLVEDVCSVYIGIDVYMCLLMFFVCVREKYWWCCAEMRRRVAEQGRMKGKGRGRERGW